MGLKSELRDIIKALKFKGDMKHKLTYYKFSKMAKKNGVIDFRIDRVAKEYTHDYLDYPEVSKEDKKWFYKQGIQSYKLNWYGITKENYQNYISDFDFYGKYNYMNREFESWFENKLNTYYLLSPFKDSMPRHYYFLKDKKILPIDVDVKKNGTVQDIVNLVNQKPIAAKAVIGGHGIGFYKFEKKENFYLVNNEKKTLEEFTELLKVLSDYIITDYIIPQKKFVEMCGEGAFSVIRVVTVYDEKDGPQITATLIRLGCKAGGLVTDYAGTIYAGLTIENGQAFNPIYRISDDYYKECKNHPDTNADLENFKMDNWEGLKDLAKSVSAYLPMTPYLVMDIIPTDNGFSILEINSHGQVRIVEPYYPFLANEYNKKVFTIKRK